jgi:general secretion pathway protein K
MIRGFRRQAGGIATNDVTAGARERRGVALFAALWLVVAIGVVALQFSLEARERRLAAANTIELAEARAAAMAGVEHAHARLDRVLRQRALQGAGPENRRAADAWLDSDTLVMIDADSGDLRYEVRVRDVNGALNINSASENQLRLFLTALDFDYGLADELAQCIMDWRDTDVMRRSRGAEREAYVAEERVVLPRDGAFQQLDELLHVMHMTPEIYDSIRPFLTLVGNGQIHVNSAPEPVLASISGMTDAAITGLMRVRSTGRRVISIQDLRAVAGNLPAAVTGTGNNATLSFQTRNVVVTSTGWNHGGRTPFQVEALITRSAAASAGSNVSWRRSR